MKKLANCCLALALVFVFVPNSQAGNGCIQLTQYCDRVQIATTAVGGEQGIELVGLWDWMCDGVTLAPVAGNFGSKITFAGYLANIGLTENWTANRRDGLADIYETADGRTESPLVLGVGFTLTPGSCGLTNPNNGKPSLNSLK